MNIGLEKLVQSITKLIDMSCGHLVNKCMCFNTHIICVHTCALVMYIIIPIYIADMHSREVSKCTELLNEAFLVKITNNNAMSTSADSVGIRILGHKCS